MFARRTCILLGKMALDAAGLAAAFGLAFVLRFEGAVPDDYVAALLAYLPWVVAVKIAVLAYGGEFRATWRYTGLGEAARLSVRLTAATALLAGWLALAHLAPTAWVGPDTVPPPYGVLLFDLVLGFLVLVTVHALARVRSEWRERQAGPASRGAGIPTLLIGAGRAGMLVAREIDARRDSGIQLRGFLDDDANLQGMRVAGLPVLGSPADLPQYIARYGVRQLIITIASAPDPARQRIVQLCKASGLPTKIVPPLHELAEGRLSLDRLREVSTDDLLGRPPIALDLREIEREIAGRTVMVTGAGGSIGSELCRVIARLKPATLVLVDQAENSLFHAHWSLVEAYPDLHLVPQIADVCDAGRMHALLTEHRPAFIFHAAAHKHVPMMEWNPGEAVKNNVLGTRTVADLAAAHGVGWFVMISTDKAVNPTSVMGVSKRVAELYVQALGRHHPTRFMTVRFGNVLGSAGSVIPIFQRQIAAGGPVTVTHPEMRRYFMTIPEACQLVLQAAALGKGNELFILDMGQPVKIVDLARALIRLSGLTPGHDIEIRYSGLRPGEKLFEELALGEEAVEQTAHARIFIGKVRAPEWQTINAQVEALGALALNADARAIRAKFKEIVPEYDCPELRRAPATSAAPQSSPRFPTSPAGCGPVLGITPA